MVAFEEVAESVVRGRLIPIDQKEEKHDVVANYF